MRAGAALEEVGRGSLVGRHPCLGLASGFVSIARRHGAEHSSGGAFDPAAGGRQDELVALTSAPSTVKDRVGAKTSEQTVRLVGRSAVIEQAAVCIDGRSVAEKATA